MRSGPTSGYCFTGCVATGFAGGNITTRQDDFALRARQCFDRLDANARVAARHDRDLAREVGLDRGDDVGGRRLLAQGARRVDDEASCAAQPGEHA